MSPLLRFSILFWVCAIAVKSARWCGILMSDNTQFNNFLAAFFAALLVFVYLNLESKNTSKESVGKEK